MLALKVSEIQHIGHWFDDWMVKIFEEACMVGAGSPWPAGAGNGAGVAGE